MNLREWARAAHKALANQPAADRIKDFSMADIENILRIGITTLTAALVRGDGLQTDDLGRLWVDERQARIVVSNLSRGSKPRRIGRRKIVRFRASDRLMRRLNGHSSNESGPETMR